MARSSRRRSTSIRSLAVLLLISIASSSVLTNLFHVHAQEPALPQPITDTDADIDPGAWTHVAPVKNAELTGGHGSVGAGGMGDGEDSRAAQGIALSTHYIINLKRIHLKTMLLSLSSRQPLQNRALPHTLPRIPFPTLTLTTSSQTDLLQSSDHSHTRLFGIDGIRAVSDPSQAHKVS